jgi:hypothetical protein
MREALTGECAGQPLSCENSLLWVPTLSGLAEGNMGKRDIASACCNSTWSVEPGMHTTLFTREPGDLGDRPERQYVTGPHREGEEP